MAFVELLTVSDRFQLTKIGLTLIPDFPLRPGWKNISEDVLLTTPDGQEFTMRAQFNATHFNIRPEYGKDWPERAWRVVISLPDATRNDVPVGTRINVSASIYRSLLGEDAEDIARNS